MADPVQEKINAIRLAFGSAIRYAGLRWKGECEVAMAAFDVNFDSLISELRRPAGRTDERPYPQPGGVMGIDDLVMADLLQEAEIIPDSLYVYFCTICKVGTGDRSWHVVGRAGLLPQTQEEHTCVRVDVAALVAGARRLQEEVDTYRIEADRFLRNWYATELERGDEIIRLRAENEQLLKENEAYRIELAAQAEGHRLLDEAFTEADEDKDNIWKFYEGKSWRSIIFWKERAEKAEAENKNLREFLGAMLDPHWWSEDVDVNGEYTTTRKIGYYEVEPRIRAALAAGREETR